MSEVKSIKIHNNDYVPVNERLKHFRQNYPEYSLKSKVLEKTADSVLIKATICDKDGRVIATGIAEELKGASRINTTSYVENCETSAWGRALANFGIGIDASVASYHEVINAIYSQSQLEKEEQEVKKKEKEEEPVDIEEILLGINTLRKRGDIKDVEIFERIKKKYGDRVDMEIIKKKSNAKKPVAKKGNRKAS
tara:strand:- start:798 stop:1382 length:585 start_codon:yes stop_codon:yes gene_type:complete